MQVTKRTIHIVKHVPTGAKVPVIVRAVDNNNVVIDYAEYTDKRKGFNLDMLQKRWDKCFDDVVEILNKYKVPAYVTHSELQSLQPNQLPVIKAIFFEEYIYAVEKKEKLSHNKLKSRFPIKFVEH